MELYQYYLTGVPQSLLVERRGSLAYGHCDWDSTSCSELPFQQVNSEGDLDHICPNLVHRLPSIGYPFNVSTHESQGCRRISGVRFQRRCLGKHQRDESPSSHGYCAICQVLVLAGRDGNTAVHEKVRADETIPYVVRILGLGTGGKVDGALYQEWLAEVECDEA